MAKATKNVLRIEKVTGVTLELTEKEARVLRSLCAAIGGAEASTWRGSTQSISDALSKIGYESEYLEAEHAITQPLPITAPGKKCFSIYAKGDLSD